jgi:flagellar hook-length control protein FliK
LAVWTSERWGGAARAARPEVAAAPSEQAVGVPQVGKAPSPELAALLQKMVAAESGPRKAGPQLEELELDAELQSDLRQWLDDGSLEAPLPESRPASAPGTAALVQTPAAAAGKTEGMAPQAPASNAAERADQLQALAQRVGQAVGQRLVSMIERGHWNVRFMLKPQQLGEIEVDLRMRSGELDAAFRATNGFTRDLLQDGLPRLREVMSSMGMDVASMNVGNGQAFKNGGNSTPQQPRSPAGQRQRESDAEPVVTAAQARTSRQRSDGLDVMV